MIHDNSTPFFMMSNEKELFAGRPPSALKERPSSEDFKKEAEAISEAIRATKARIEDYKSAKANVKDLELHLASLEKRLEETKAKI